MRIAAAKDRREAIIRRELELAVLMTEGRRAFFATGVETPRVERAEQEAELARLALEKHDVTTKLNLHKVVAKAYRQTLAHAVLIKLVSDRGMPELVIEADRTALEASQVEGAEA